MINFPPYIVSVLGMIMIVSSSEKLQTNAVASIKIETNIEVDTLIVRDSILVYPGKKITLLSGKWSKERYYSIRLKTSLSFQGMFLRNMEIKNNLEYKQDPYLFEVDRARSLVYGINEFVVTKVEKLGNNKRGYINIAYFKVKGTNLRCDLNLALDSSEIRIDYNN